MSQWDFEDLMDLLNDQGGLRSFFFELEGCCLSSFLLGWLIVGSLKTLWYICSKTSKLCFYSLGIQLWHHFLDLCFT